MPNLVSLVYLVLILGLWWFIVVYSATKPKGISEFNPLSFLNKDFYLKNNWTLLALRHDIKQMPVMCLSKLIWHEVKNAHATRRIGTATGPLLHRATKLIIKCSLLPCSLQLFTCRCFDLLHTVLKTGVFIRQHVKNEVSMDANFIQHII